jgi:ADP-ribose pyrophosphatase YjhB (NUDIX family)
MRTLPQRKAIMNLKYELIFRLKKVYWFVFRPQTTGVKCAIVNNGQILMIKRKFGSSQWVFPGGAVKLGEAKDVAIRREIEEDLGIELNDVRYLGSFTQNVHHRRETMHCFTAAVLSRSVSVDDEKIKSVNWFDRSKLPELTPISRSVISLFDSKPSVSADKEV